jgi:putative ABC transport system permease protein
MNLIVKLGWRNVWRNKRRSIITIGAVAFAVMLSIAMRGMQLGTYEVNIRHVVKLFSGYIQIQAQGYQDNPSLQKSFLLSDSLRFLLDKTPHVIAWTPRASGDGLVSYEETSVGARILGIDPVRESATSTLATKVTGGSFLSAHEEDGIVVGQTLLENLKAHIGDTVVVLAQGFDGSLGNMKYRIVGVFKTGSPDYDAGSILMDLTAAQDLLSLYGRVSILTVMLDDLDAISDAKESLNESLAGTGLKALDWSEVMPDFAQSIQLDNVSGMLMLAILIIVVAFGITNTVLMSVTERFREFGIVLAMGMPQRKLAMVVLLETLSIVMIGLVIGNLLAVGINAYLVAYPIEFGAEFGAIYEEYGFLPRLESTMKPTMFLNSSLAVLAISLVAAIYPLTKVLRLEPLKGIRYT